MRFDTYTKDADEINRCEQYTIGPNVVSSRPYKTQLST